MEREIRIVHWYDTERHHVACGAPGQSNSTKHPRGVTCTACLTLVADSRAPRATGAETEPEASVVH